MKKAPLRSLLLGGSALIIATLSCGREPTGPGGRDFVASKALGFTPEFPAGFPAYQAAGGSGIAFSKVRIVLTKLDRLVALDTTVTYPDTATSLQLTLRVLLPASTSTAGVPMVLNLDYIAADGTVVFHGGPAMVSVIPITSDSTPPPPTDVTIPIRYTGPGAKAKSVVIAPSTLQADSGAAIAFTAQARDSTGNVVPNTPIAFSSQDTTIATVNAVTGAGKAGSTRGSTGIVAQLLTGQTSTAILTVVKPAATLQAISGGGQSGPVSTVLAQPVKVRVTATDALPSPGVAVTFATTGGGTVGATTVTTGADGMAQTTWTLGATPGSQTLTATVAGLAGSPVTFTATGIAAGPGPATHLAFTAQPSNALPATAITPAIVVTALDSANVVATSFTGSVTLALGANPGAATLSGTVSLAAVAGVASFANVKLDNVSTGYTLVASATGLTGATSSAFNIVVASSTVVSPHVDTVTAIGGTFALSAQARDASNNPVTGTFTWVSRSPGVATVSTSGVVTAVTNGSTWVVATEAGGTKDSAQIVVEQRLASITVTPNPRNIYLGAKYQFAASAVDGRGVPMVSQPTFTWTTASGSVATVDAAGLATATGIGSTQVKATSGTVTGVANVNVLTQITRIVVSRDSAGFSKTASDTFALTSLDSTRSYVATARDTLDQPMIGITFAWTSSNGAVAIIDSSGTGATARARSAANGVTAIRATAQGVTGAAQLTVQQVLVGIDLSPTTAVVAPTGKTVLLARGLDAKGHFIPGGTFTWASTQPSIATVDTAGVVTGVANGTTNITASSGAIASNASTITVGGTVPPAISFGRDTLTVGRSGSKSIPVYLSTPYGSPLTVNLGVADTAAHFSTASVSIPAGQTSVNATLIGHNAGTTLAYATDGSGAGYAGDTAVLAVQASVKFTSTSYSLNVTDQMSTQVLLSDPSPAGGTYVTYSYGTPGKLGVSPDPAFIPAGQLAADVVILATGTNTSGTTLTPSATGVSGTASTVYTYAATFSGPTRLLLGAGQFEQNQYVQVSAYQQNPLPITLTSSDTSKVTASPTNFAIAKNAYYEYFNIAGVAIGTGIITATSPGWTPHADTVTVSTPKVGMCCSGTHNTTSPQFPIYVYAEDSTSNSHYRTSGLVVSLTSTDPSVLSLLSPTVTIPAGEYYTTAQVAPGGGTGTARIIATASGHNPDSTGVYTVVGPKLSFSWSTLRVGAGENDQDLYVYTPNTVTGSPVVVTITNRDSSIVGMPPTITIPVGTNYTYFTVRGKSPGTDSLFASAPGYSPDTAVYIVTTPKIVLSGGTTLNNFTAPYTFYTYAADTTRNTHYATAPVVVTYTSSDPSVLAVSGADTIQVGSYYTSHATVTPVAVGTAKVIASAGGFLPDTASYTVQMPKLNLSWTTARLGRRQYQPQGYYVSTPGNRLSPLAVTLTQLHPTVDSLSQTSITIATNSNVTYFDIAGLATGADTIIASATGYSPDTAVMVVTTPKLIASSIPSPSTTTSPPATITVYTADSLSTTHYSLDTLIVRAVSSNSAVLQPAARGFRINPGTYYSQPQVSFTGPGTATVTYDDSLTTGYVPVTTNTVTVTGPSLNFGGGTIVLGKRQNDAGGTYVYTPNNVLAPLKIALASSDTTVATVPDTVTIPTGFDYVYFQTTAHDSTGTVQIQATAIGYNGASRNVQVTPAQFVLYGPTSVNTTSPPQPVYVYAADADGNTHYPNEDVVVTLASSAPSVGTIDSATVTIPANQYYSYAARFIPLSVGTTQLMASDARVAAYKYGSATANVAVNTPTLYLYTGYNSLGIGQYDNATVETPDYTTSDLTVNLSHYSAATTSPSSVTITSGNYYTYAKILGAATGADSITISATGFVPAKQGLLVANGLLGPVGGWPSQINQGDSVAVQIYARDFNQITHYVNANTTVTLAASGNIQFVSGGANSAVITSATILADQQYVQVWVKALNTGSGSGFATISATNYTLYVTPTINVP